MPRHHRDDLRHGPLTTAAIDPGLLVGWGVRPRDWQFGVSVQQQLLPRVSLEVGYLKRWLQNFTATDNLAVTPSRLHAVQHHRALRSSAARWRRLRRRRSLQRRPGEVRADQQQHRAHRQAVPELQRHAAQPQRASQNGLTLPGRHQQRKTGDRLLRLAIRFAGAVAGHRRCHSEPDESVLPGRSGLVTKSPASPRTRSQIDVLIAGTFRSDQGAPLRAT